VEFLVLFLESIITYLSDNYYLVELITALANILLLGWQFESGVSGRTERETEPGLTGSCHVAPGCLLMSIRPNS
jgi:hypothetical protein